ncbi:hypothetical protein PAXINDRAFT_8625 [Paxillus involutus ATCC 200175]|nr:hypothetical protein PAXINDRAFT_8625 [Paxillus involutus ATCC 200175]
MVARSSSVCNVALAKVNSLDNANIIAQQREVVIATIKEKLHIAYQDLPQFQKVQRKACGGPERYSSASESGQTPGMTSMATFSTPKNVEQNFLYRFLGDLKAHPNGVRWVSSDPVSSDVRVLTILFNTMEHKRNTNQYQISGPTWTMPS